MDILPFKLIDVLRLTLFIFMPESEYAQHGANLGNSKKLLNVFFRRCTVRRETAMHLNPA